MFYLAAALNLPAQGTAILYQGRLNDSGAPGNTNYDFRFAVYDAPTNGNRVSLWLTNAAVPVAGGLFAVTLDFGPGVFNGTDNGSNDWLDIAVRASGAASFTALAPRQPILPAPYAIFATGASNLLGGLQSTQLVGTIPPALVTGTFPGSVNFSNAANNFAGAFSGNGAGLYNLNGSAVASGTVADARLSANVALLNASQTYTGANTFAGTGTYTGANTFNNLANSFSGSFYGNGLVGWNPLTATATNATSDHGYLALSTGLTTVTLPVSPSVDDIVRVAGGGTGGWLVKHNSGQFIAGNFAAYRNGFLAQKQTADDYYDVAASADGIRMYAVASDLTGVYASSDSGQNWNQVSGLNLSGDYFSVACSASGKIVYASPYGGGTVRKSSDGGVTWATTSSSAASGKFISCTADGSKVFTTDYACSGNGTYLAKLSGGVITISTNGGTSFNVAVTAPASGLTCLAASSDCTKLVAGVSGGALYASSDLGHTWTTISLTNQLWSGAWMSPDGSKLAVSFNKTASAAGGIYSCSISAQPNTATTTSSGSLCGSQGSAVELQYLGGGQFMPVSSTGLIWAN